MAKRKKSSLVTQNRVQVDVFLLGKNPLNGHEKQMTILPKQRTGAKKSKKAQTSIKPQTQTKKNPQNPNYKNSVP